MQWRHGIYHHNTLLIISVLINTSLIKMLFEQSLYVSVLLFYSSLIHKRINAHFYVCLGIYIYILTTERIWVPPTKSLFCWQGFEYADCIYCRGVRSPPIKRVVLNMILDSIWWWGSSSGTLESVVYSFIAITPRSNLVQSGRTLKSNLCAK